MRYNNINKIITIKMTNPGLNSGAVLQNLQSVTSTQVNYATENYVTQQITDKINQGYSLTIDIENAGVCIFTTSANSKTVVEIGISTTLTDLSDVNITSTPPSNSYLVYNGASWTIGSGVSKFSITDLNDFVPVNSALVPDAFLRVNPAGTSIIQQVNDVVSDVLPGNGIQVVTANTVRTINSDFATLPIMFDVTQDSPDNYFPILNSGNTLRIQKNLIDLSGFKNSEFFVKSSGISAYAIGSGSCPNMLTATSTGATVDIILNTDNLITGVCGITSIEKGGTSASNIVGARRNLGLVYNEDIISYNRGLFQQNLAGDNILLINGISNFTISPGSSGFTDGTCIKPPLGYPDTEVTYVAAGGSVISISGISPFDAFSPRNNTFELIPDSGTSYAFVTINFDDHSYLNFGVSSGNQRASGLGLRYGLSDGVQFRESFGTSWRSLTNKFGVSGLTDVGSSTFFDSQILIYNGTCNLWFPRTISGATLNNSGGLSINVTPESIVTGVCPITTDEFLGLSGFNSVFGGTIQKQLNNKIQVTTPTLQAGDLIYYNSLPGVSQFTRVPKSGNQRYFLREKTTPGGSIPGYDNIYHGFDNQTLGNGVSPGSFFCILNEGTCVAESYSLSDTNRFLTGKVGTTGPSTGIDVNEEGVLTLNYNELNPISSISSENIISIGTSLSAGVCYVQRATIEKFVSEIAGTSSGIGHCISKLRLEIPFFPKDTDVIAPGPYRGQLVFFTNATAPGTSVLAVYDGSNWHGTTTSLVTF